MMGHHYYNDLHSYLGLKDIGQALADAGIPGAESVSREAQDYRSCIRQSLDRAILPVAQFAEAEGAYDYSGYAYLRPDGTLEPVAPAGRVPERWQDRIFLRDEAEAAGLQMYVPSAADHRVPLKYPANGMDVATMPFLGCTDILDPDGDSPLVPGSAYTDRQVWDAIVAYFRASGAIGRDGLLFDADGAPGYSYNLAQFFFWRDRMDDFLNAAFGTIAFTSPMADFAAVESVKNLVPHPFWNVVPMGLTMARCRDYLRQMLLTEDVRTNALLIAPAVPRAWFTEGQVVAFYGAPTRYGRVSFRIESSYSSSGRIRGNVELDLRRLPSVVKVRFRPPGAAPIQELTVNGGRQVPPTDEWIGIHPSGLQQRLEIVAGY
jgi:hypothetical protein